MYPHRIRLRGPWDYEPLFSKQAQTEGQTESSALPGPGRMTIPSRWKEGGLGEFSGSVRFRRRFGWPGRIDSHERVWLTFAGVHSLAKVWLNGQWIGEQLQGDVPFELEITGRLQERNELIVEVESKDGEGGLWGEVALEVRCTAYLRGIRIHTTSNGSRPVLEVTGTLVGTCDRPLELYLLLEGKTVDYATLETAPESTMFHLKTELPGNSSRESPHLVRIDLVNAASIWYTHEQQVLMAEFTPLSEEYSHDDPH